MGEEESASEWFGAESSPMRDWFLQAIRDKAQHQDIGKVLSPGAEIYINAWLLRKTGRPIRHVTGVSYDGITDDDLPPIRHQTKFRMSSWHLETTRRHKHAPGTTRVNYSKDEFDVLIIFIPGPHFSLSRARIRCIPIDVLIDPKKPTYLCRSVPKHIQRVYDTDEKTEEVLQTVYG
jgi:hypothetical protein